MNLIQVSDQLKNLSDQQLAGLMQSPNGMAPEYLVLSELKRREKIQAEYAGQQEAPPETTLAEEATMGAMGMAPPPAPGDMGLGSMMPPGGDPGAPVQAFAAGGGVMGDWAGRLQADLMRDYQLAPHQAAGIVGNLAHETGGFKHFQELRPIVPGSRGGFGIAQWTGPRRRAMEGWSSQKGLDPRTYQANYGFLRHELDNTPEGSVLGLIRKAPNVASATKAFSDKFLRPGIVGMKSRMNWAMKVAGMKPGEGNRDPEAAALSYGATPQPQADAGLGAIVKAMAPDAMGGDEGGLQVLAQAKQRQQEELAQAKELALMATQPLNQGQEAPDPDQFLQKRAKFAEGGEVWPGGRQPPLMDGLPSTEQYYEAQPVPGPGLLDRVLQWARENASPRVNEFSDWAGGEEPKKETKADTPKMREPQNPARPTTPIVNPNKAAPAEDPDMETGAVGDPMYNTGLGDLVTQMAALRSDPYAEIRTQIDGLDDGLMDDQRGSWDDLARFGFALASTGNVGDAGLAMMEGRDKRSATREAIRQKQLQLNASLAEARAAAERGDINLAADIYSKQIAQDTAIQVAGIRSAGASGPGVMKPGESGKLKNDIIKEVHAEIDPSNITGKYATMTDEQIAALRAHEVERRWAEVQKAAASGANVGEPVNDIADE